MALCAAGSFRKDPPGRDLYFPGHKVAPPEEPAGLSPAPRGAPRTRSASSRSGRSPRGLRRAPRGRPPARLSCGRVLPPPGERAEAERPPPVPSGEESRPGARRDFGGAARPTRRLPWGWAPPLVSDGKAAPPLADGPPPPGRESQGCPAASRETGARPAALGTRSEAPPSPVPRLRGGRAERRAGPWAGLARGGSGSGSGSEASMGARRVQPPASPTWSSG